jgi:HlyD family secretion protein
VRTRPVRIVAVVALVAAAAALWYYTRPEPVEVVAEAVQRGMVEKTVANTRAGTVEACLRAFPTPSVGGQIAELAVREGQMVEKGELLLELWNDDIEAEVALARSERDAAVSSARAACLQAEVAEREAERLVKLQKKGVASEDQTDRVVTESKAAQAQCQAARANVEVSTSRVGVTEAKLARTRLTAPFSGIVAEVTGEVSQYVTPSPPGIATPPIVDLIGLDCFYVTAPIDEVDAPGIAPGMPARITLDAYGDRAFEGRVRRVAPYVQALEKQARTVDVEVEFVREQDRERLLAGYSADVEVILEVRSDTLRIPTEAVVDNDRVYVLTADGAIDEREVKTGVANWDFTEVLEGVEADELIVTSVDREGVEDGAAAALESAAP